MRTAAWVSGLMLVGCATPGDIARQEVAGRFESSLSAKMLANCIDRNAENRLFAGAFRSKIRDTGVEPIEVVVMANAGYVSALVEIKSAGTGSTALFRFGGAAEMDEAMSKGSVLRKYAAGCD